MESGTTEVVNAPVSAAEAVTETETVTREERLKIAESKLKKRGFWLQFSAWAVALAVLIASLVYFNFFAATSNVMVYKVGDKCPDFTLGTVYKNAGSCDGDGNQIINRFSVLESRGKVTVINYWETTCDPCKEELPWFERIYREYGECLRRFLFTILINFSLRILLRCSTRLRLPCPAEQSL